MPETLQEYVHSRGESLRVDPAAGVIRGVKLLGLESRNGRSYLPEALAQAAPLYEGAKVNVNHPPGDPRAPRDYRDRIGVIRGVALRRESGLYGDLHFNPLHPLAGQLAWDAEHAPENVGFSHNVEARTARQGERLVVEAILRVQSVDLVADPATTRGLFESAAEGDAPDGAGQAPEPGAAQDVAEGAAAAGGDSATEGLAALTAATARLAALLESVEQTLRGLSLESAVRGGESAARAGLPASREQSLAEGTAASRLSAAEFVAAISRQ